MSHQLTEQVVGSASAEAGSGSGDGAAAFEEGDVAPAAVVAADALAGADAAESGSQGSRREGLFWGKTPVWMVQGSFPWSKGAQVGGSGLEAGVPPGPLGGP